MSIEIHYGKTKLALHLDKHLHVDILQKHPMPIESDPFVAVGTAMSQPVGCAALTSIARGARTACIVICDITRPVPNHLFLRTLVERLLRAGLSHEDILILVATGLHRPNEGEELMELVGDEWIVKNIQIQNHDARNDSMHIDLGKTKRGTPVKLDRRFVESDIRIVTGLVEPHFMAGYSGGRKVIAPGIAHRETITTFHNAWFMAHPKATNCVLEGNPLHEEQLEIVRMLGDVYAVNTVIDEQRRLSFINFGEVVASHQLAVAHCEKYSKVIVPRRYRTVVTSAAGYPLDKTYYQTIKGMVGAMEILAPGGTLIIASECSEGLGSIEYRAAQQRLVSLGSEQFLHSLEGKPMADIDEWQSQMQLRPMGQGRILLYTTGLSAEDQLLTGVETVDSIEEAVRFSAHSSGDPNVAVIPEGPYVIPVCDDSGGN